MSEGTWTKVKDKWKEYCVWSIKGCEKDLDVLTHWLATPIICPVLLLHDIPIFQHRSLFSDYPEAGGWNLLQPPVTRYQSTRCHTSEYFKNQCSCEKLKCKNTRSWPCCTLYLSVTWSSFRPRLETSPFGAKWWLQSSYSAKLRKMKDVYSHHPEHVMACSCRVFSWYIVLWYTQLSPSARASLNIRMFPPHPFKYINLIPVPRG